MKKSKFLKPFSFASLALLMGAAGVFAFAPLGANPSLASASEAIETTTEQGLITPKADDPVIYTTESGIEIKWGNAPNLNNSLSEGNLNGFPYFTTSKSGTTYTWVIIGRNTNDDVFLEQITHHLFSSWKTNNSKHSGTYEHKGYYFFKDTYESTTPAGTAINGVVPSKSYVADVTKVTKTVVGTEEIPSGCVLAVLNKAYQRVNYYSGNSYLNARNTCFDGELNTLRLTHVGYAQNDDFGFGTYLNSIQNTTVYQTNQWWNGSAWQTDVQNSADLKFFPLATGTFSNENFCVYNYITVAQYITGDSLHPYGRSTQITDWGYRYGTLQAPCMIDGNTGNIWTGDNGGHYMASSNGGGTSLWYSRPACVIKFS